MKTLRYLPLAVLGCGLAGLIVVNSAVRAADEKPASGEKPKITIKNVPSIGPGNGATDDIDGTVTGAKPSEHKVVIYSYGDKWYVQPTVADPLTDIDSDGKWESKIYGGLEYA